MLAALIARLFRSCRHERAERYHAENKYLMAYCPDCNRSWSVEP